MSSHAQYRWIELAPQFKISRTKLIFFVAGASPELSILATFFGDIILTTPLLFVELGLCGMNLLERSYAESGEESSVTTPRIAAAQPRPGHPEHASRGFLRRQFRVGLGKNFGAEIPAELTVRVPPTTFGRLVRSGLPQPILHLSRDLLHCLRWLVGAIVGPTRSLTDSPSIFVPAKIPWLREDPS